MERFFYSYQQLETDMENLQNKFPGKLQISCAAVTADGRRVWELTAGEMRARRHVLVHGGIHGREYLNCAVLMRLLEEYLASGMLRDICVHVLPMVNPDGCTISQSGMEEIKRPHLRSFLKTCWEEEKQRAMAAGRKLPEASRYFSRWKANARGVDMNRNFDAGWETYGGPQNPGPEGYKGEAPGSEPETRAILELQKRQAFACCIAYHSSGRLIYWDYGSGKALQKQERRLAKSLGKALGYPLHSTVADGTDQAGCSDYFVRACGIPAVTIETGSSDCPLPSWEFEKIFQENRGLWEALENYCKTLSSI